MQFPVLLLLIISIQQELCHCERLPTTLVIPNVTRTSVSTVQLIKPIVLADSASSPRKVFSKKVSSATKPAKKKQPRSTTTSKLSKRRDENTEPSRTETTQLDPLPDFSFVVPFVYKQRFPAATVCSGTIVTEKLILTAAYPMAILPRYSYCALPGYPRLSNATLEDIENDCISLKKVQLDSEWEANAGALNLAIVELVRPIKFSWYVSTGRIIFREGPLNEQFANVCTLPGWKYRSAITAPGFPLKEVATELVSHEVFVSFDEKLYGNLFPSSDSEVIHMCTAHIGMPVICECKIVGVLALESLKGDLSCAGSDSVSFVYLLHPSAQQFLNISIPETSDISEGEGAYGEMKKRNHPLLVDEFRIIVNSTCL